MTKDPNWKDLFEASPKICPVLELMVNRTLWPWWKWNQDRDDDNLRKNKEQNNFYRVHFRHEFCRSKNESGMIHFPLMTTIAETFQTRWQGFYNMMVFEKTMGERCNAGFVAQTPDWKSGRSRYGLNDQERGSNKQRCVWIETEIFCVCVLSDASMKEIKLVYHCRTMSQSRAFGSNTFNTPVLRCLANLLINQVWLLEEEIWKKADKPCCSQWCPWAKHMKTTWKRLERYFHELTGMCTRMHFFGSIGKMLKTENSHLRKRLPLSASSTTMCHPTLLKKWQISKPAKFWINGFVIATIATKVTRRSVWQVRRESTEKHVADKVTTRPEVGVRCQGLPRKERQQHEESSREQNIGRFVHAIISHPNKSLHSFIVELHSNSSRMPFSEESNQIIHTKG